MKISQENNIYDSSNKIILTYPPNTLLDRIYIDIWSIIYKYRNIHHQIFIGHCNKKYPGYKPLKYDGKMNIIFSETFREIYKANNGYIALDDCKPNTRISFSDGYSIAFRNKLVTVDPHSTNKLICRLETFGSYGHEIVSNNMSDAYKSSLQNASLCFFVTNEYPR